MSTHRTHYKVAIILNIVIFCILALFSLTSIRGSFDFIPLVYSLIVGVLVLWLYRTESWIPALFLICFSLATSIPLFIIDSMLLEEVMIGLYISAGINLALGIPVYIYTFIIMLVFRKRFAYDNVPLNDYRTKKGRGKSKSTEGRETQEKIAARKSNQKEKEPIRFKEKSATNSCNENSMVLDNLMLSQYAAWYVLQGSETHKIQYIRILKSLGFTEEEALKLLAFEGDIIKKYDKTYLLHPKYNIMWLFNLEKPCFTTYPCEKDDILKEHSMSLSEICKTIDEAEWHYWNSHDEDISDEVWEEIVQWHLKGSGGSFALKYFDMISQQTGIPSEKIHHYSSHEGTHLKKYKWRAPDFDPLKKPSVAEDIISELQKDKKDVESVFTAEKAVSEPIKKDSNVPEISTITDDSILKKENTLIRNNNNENLKDINTNFDWRSILDKSDSFKKSANGLYTWMYRDREAATFYANGKSFLAQKYPIPEEWADLLNILTIAVSSFYNTDCNIAISAGLTAFKIGFMDVSSGKPSTSLIEGADYDLKLSFSYISRGESLKEKLGLEDPKEKMTTDELTKIFEKYLALPSIIYNSKRGTPLYNDFFNTINLGRIEMEKNPDLMFQATKWTKKDFQKMLKTENEGLGRILIVSLVFLTGAYAFVQESEYRTSNQKEVPNCISLAVIAILLKTGQSNIPLHVNGNYDPLDNPISIVMDMLKNTPEIQGGAEVFLIEHD